MIRWLLHADCFGLTIVPCLFFRSWQALNLCFLFSFFFKDNTLAFIKSEGELKEILKEVKYNGIFSTRDHKYHSDWYSWDSRWLKLKNHERVLSKNSLKEVKLTAQCGKSRWKWFGLNIGVRFAILSIVLVLFTSKLYAEFNKWFNSKPQCATVKTEQAAFFLSLRSYDYRLVKCWNSVACGFKNIMGLKVRWNLFSSIMATLDSTKLANLHSRWG